jgi:hypothetical protein
LTSLHEALAWFETPLFPVICVSLMGRTLHRSSSSVNLHGGFDESSPYWCSLHPTSFWEPIDVLVSPFHRHLQLWLHFERMKDARFLDLPDDPHVRL